MSHPPIDDSPREVFIYGERREIPAFAADFIAQLQRENYRLHRDFRHHLRDEFQPDDHAPDWVEVKP